MRAIKQPSEKVTFTYDFTTDLGVDNNGAPIAIGSVDGVPVSVARGAGANLTQSGAAAISGTAVLVTWQGGDPGESYHTTVKIIDAAGNKHERDGEIFVVDQGFTLEPGISTRYMTAEEYVERYGYAETVRLTDEDKTNVVDTAKIEAALTDATEIADAYIGTRYTTPLVDVPRIVKSIIGALARETLFKSRPFPEVTAAAERARTQLRDIAAGRMTLPVDQGQEEPIIGGNRLSVTSGDSSSSFRDAVSGYSVDQGSRFANWRQ